MGSKSNFTLGFSSCPNDCFIFDAMIHGKIDTEGLKFNIVMDDVETLNKKAFEAELDITKLSYNAYLYLTKKYVLLDGGSALGFNCGPILISKKKILNPKSQILNFKIAIPGKYTTANLLLSIAFPEVKNKIEMVFSEIENAVLKGEVDAGLIIHENRFTYQERGLHKIIDLGEFWESLIHAPIPLGGIVIKRNISDDIKQKVNRVIRRSVEYAFANPASSSNFVKANSQEMDEEVMKKHIDLYVNKFSIDLGEEGKKAVKLLFDKAVEKEIINKAQEEIFLK